MKISDICTLFYVSIIFMTNEFQIVSKSEEDTMNIARTIAPLFNPGDLILLEGDLGLGKTHFVKGFAEGLSSKNTVTSPTFSLANFYKTERSDLLHIDLYRVSDIDEYNDLGLSDYFPQSIVMIEWGLKFADYMDEHILVSFMLKENNERLITFSSDISRYNTKINLIKEKLEGGELC